MLHPSPTLPPGHLRMYICIRMCKSTVAGLSVCLSSSLPSALCRDVTCHTLFMYQANLEVYLTRLVVSHGGENKAAFTTGPLVPLGPGDEPAQVCMYLCTMILRGFLTDVISETVCSFFLFFVARRACFFVSSSSPRQSSNLLRRVLFCLSLSPSTLWRESASRRLSRGRLFPAFTSPRGAFCPTVCFCVARQEPCACCRFRGERWRTALLGGGMLAAPGLRRFFRDLHRCCCS